MSEWVCNAKHAFWISPNLGQQGKSCASFLFFLTQNPSVAPLIFSLFISERLILWVQHRLKGQRQLCNNGAPTRCSLTFRTLPPFPPFYRFKRFSSISLVKQNHNPNNNCRGDGITQSLLLFQLIDEAKKGIIVPQCVTLIWILSFLWVMTWPHDRLWKSSLPLLFNELPRRRLLRHPRAFLYHPSPLRTATLSPPGGGAVLVCRRR